MAKLTTCKVCGQSVSTQARACPHCGHKVAGRIGFWKGLLIVLGVLFIIGLIAPDPEKKGGTQLQEAVAPEQQVSDKRTPERATAVSVQNEKEQTAKGSLPAQKRELADEECRKNLQCWGDKVSIKGSFTCAPLVERMAKFDHRWTDGWLGGKFTYFRWADPEKGVVTLIGDTVQFQNGFGAYSNMIYECDYDYDSDAVLDLRIREGRL